MMGEAKKKRRARSGLESGHLHMKGTKVENKLRRQGVARRAGELPVPKARNWFSAVLKGKAEHASVTFMPDKKDAKPLGDPNEGTCLRSTGHRPYNTTTR
jgi:hypothetical protein